MRTYAEFYGSIALPPFAPPAWVFGVAWGIIYPLFAAALIYTFILARRGRLPWKHFGILVTNLAANLLFTPVQLGFSAFWPASIVILVVLETLIHFEWVIRKYSKIIFFLMLPYLLWAAFATALQLTIAAMN